MKYRRLVLSLSLVAFLATFSIAAADSSCSSCSATSCSAAPVDLIIAKATEKTATVTVGSKTATAPISFGDGASWDSVKDSYSVASSTASALAAGTMAISIGSDGTASFTKCAANCSAKSDKKK